MIVILLNGYPQSGKDTFADVAMRKYIYSHKHSTIDACREFAQTMGWDGVKTPKSRKMLSDLKKFYVEHFDGPFRDLKADINWAKNGGLELFFTFSREGDEIERIRFWCKEEGIPFYYIFIVRNNDSIVDHGNDSDNNIKDGPKPDYICYNTWNDIHKYEKEILCIVNNIINISK